MVWSVSGYRGVGMYLQIDGQHDSLVSLSAITKQNLD